MFKTSQATATTTTSARANSDQDYSENRMNRGGKKSRRPTQVYQIKLSWPISLTKTVFIATVLIATCYSSVKNCSPNTCGYYSPRLCGRAVPVFSLGVHLAGHQRIFLQWAVAVRFLNDSRWSTQGKWRVVLIVHAESLRRLFFLEAHAILLTWYLLSCGDVESNPGPQWMQGSNQHHYNHDHNYAPEPVLCSNPAHQSELHRNLFSLAGYQMQPPSVTENGADKLQSWCEVFQRENAQLREEIHHLSNLFTALYEQCKSLLHLKDWFTDAAQKMENQIDKVESFSRRNNLRFFNVLENENENDQECLTKVVQLLNRYFPIKKWSEDDVDNAHRLGQRNRNHRYFRPIIVRLFSWRNKLTILRARECRRDLANCEGIRIASDLTDRQNQIVREERNAGRHVYVQKGRLVYNRKNLRHRVKTSRWRTMDHRESTQTNTNMFDTIDCGQSAHSEGYCEPSNRRDSTPPAPELNFHGTQIQQPLSNNPSSLPWTADMRAFPGFQTNHKQVRPNTAESRKQGTTFEHPDPKPSESSFVMSTTVSQGNSFPPTNTNSELPQPQRQPRTKTVIDKWGARLCPVSDERNDLQIPGKEPDCPDSTIPKAIEVIPSGSTAAPSDTTPHGNNSSVLCTPQPNPNPMSSSLLTTCLPIRSDPVQRPQETILGLDPVSNDEKRSPVHPAIPSDVESQTPGNTCLADPSVDSHIESQLDSPVYPCCEKSPDNRPMSGINAGVFPVPGHPKPKVKNASVTHVNETNNPSPPKAPVTRRQNKNKLTRLNERSKQTRLTEKFTVMNPVNTPVYNAGK